jgi:hypothetical protein
MIATESIKIAVSAAPIGLAVKDVHCRTLELTTFLIGEKFLPQMSWITFATWHMKEAPLTSALDA